MISRRSFLVLSGGVLLPLPAVPRKESAPSMLDHILLGCNDLERGIGFVEQHTGVRAAFGGVHPGRGTQNALLSLGERRYLEIIAPDPEQAGVRGYDRMLKLTEPRLIGWAAHVDDVDQLAARLRKAGVGFEGPQPGSRRRPDGRVLSWKSLSLNNDYSVLPFFIEWAADSIHPSVDAPKGCSLASFEAVMPDTDKLTRLSGLLGLDLPIAKGAKPRLGAVLAGPKGELSLAS